jgi:hypothetical protein
VARVYWTDPARDRSEALPQADQDAINSLLANVAQWPEMYAVACSTKQSDASKRVVAYRTTTSGRQSKEEREGSGGRHLWRSTPEVVGVGRDEVVPRFGHGVVLEDGLDGAHRLAGAAADCLLRPGTAKTRGWSAERYGATAPGPRRRWC